MSLLGDEMEDALEEHEDDLDGPTCTINGETVPCVPSTLRRGTQVQVGGDLVDIQFTLLIRKSQLRTRITADITTLTTDATASPSSADNTTPDPATGQKLTHRQRTYRIAAVRDPAAGSHWEIDLADPNR